MNKIYNTTLSYKANEEDAGKTAEHILKYRLNISAGLIKKLKLTGKIKINENVCRSVDIVKFSDIVSADIEEVEVSQIPEYKFKLDILFEDAHLLVVNKPPRISMHPCLGDYDKTLAGAIIHHWRKNGEEHNFHAVNRLDKNTSGICIIAKNRYCHGILSGQAKDLIEKEYTAIVRGKLDTRGTINAPIKRADESIIKRIVDSDGKEAITVYSPVDSNDNYTIVKIKLLTGRTHQIRVHFSYIGHPLYGDWLYGLGDKEGHLIERHALVSDKIKFYHPVSGEPLEFNVDLPDDMKSLILTLKN